MQRYLVGGALRDEMLGLTINDRDWVVVGASPEDMVAAGYTPVGRDFPVFLHPRTREEHALARTERKTGHGYHGFVFHTGADVSLEDDLHRRDLTINAMARDDDGQLVDPYGGCQDLQNKVLRHVSPAFGEDPVRLLRLARYYTRFAPLGFTVAESTLQLARDMVSAGEVDHLVAERVWAELERALMEDEPQLFFYLLRQVGALARILPELDQLFGVIQPARYHPEIDSGIHTMLVLAQTARAQASLSVRLAALCHDFGKGTTPASILPGHRGHEERGVPLVQQACRRLNIPKRHRETAVLVTRWHTHLHRLRRLRPATVLQLLEGMDALRRPERMEDLIAVCQADVRGRLGHEDRPYPQAQLLRRAQQAALQITGARLARQGLSGPAIGEELRRQRIQAIAEALG